MSFFAHVVSAAIELTSASRAGADRAIPRAGDLLDGRAASLPRLADDESEVTVEPDEGLGSLHAHMPGFR